ncbi:MAG: site-specific integrase [Planctomycetaceae bacterium]
MVDRPLLERYAAWLDSQTYAYRTEYLELSTIKQCIKWLVKNDLLPAECEIDMPLKKASGTDTYCWSHAEVRAMRTYCQENSELHWLHGVIVALACTGLRISELASLRWSDIDFDDQRISLTDTSKSSVKKKRQKRSTKTGHSRSFPIHPELLSVLHGLPKATDGLIFHGPRGGKIKPDTVRQILIRDVLKPLAADFPTADDEVGFADGRLHSFRHYFCSVCAHQNVPEQLMMNWLGHRQSAMVKHYYHVDQEEAARRMSGLDLV